MSEPQARTQGAGVPNGDTPLKPTDPTRTGLLAPLAPWARSDAKRALWQVANTVLPMILFWYLMFRTLEVSFWITLALAPIAGGLLVRTFIIYHDCGHGSFFRARRANEIVGFLTGILTLFPTHSWWREHAIHHATAGNLDRRNVGDVWTLTVREYMAAPFWTRLGYRTFRHPAVMFLLGPIFTFVIRNRYVWPTAGPRESRSVHLANATLAVVITLLILAVGWKAYLTVHALIFAFGAPAGVWLFYVQHNYEGVYWARNGEWDYASVGLQGSSYYRLPRVLQWFTGNIGFHHVHHLSPRVPNYFLGPCHRANAIFREVPVVTLRSSFRCLFLRLYDEETGRMVGFGRVRELRAAAAS